MGGRGASSATGKAEGARVRAALTEAPAVIFALQGLGYNTSRPASKLLYGKPKAGADSSTLRQARDAYEAVMKRMGYTTREQLDAQIASLWFG